MTVASKLNVSVGTDNRELSTALGTGDAYFPAISTCTLDTDSTFQVAPVVDFGSSVVGGVAGIRVTADSWAGDSETFAAGSVFLYICNFETSVDGSNWQAVSPTTLSSVAAAPVASNTSSIFNVADFLVWLVPTARYLRWLMYLAQ